MDMEFEQMLEEMKKMPRGTENSCKIMKKITTMFGVSFESSIDSQLHQKFWQAARKLIEAMNGAERIVTENVHNLIIGQVTALSIKVHGIYAIPDYGLPRVLTVSNIVVVVPKRKKVEKKWKTRVFCAFLMLRLGDLMRYKGYISKAKEFYEISLKINHTDKETWNQLGVVHFKSADFLTAVYYHTRSLHTTVPFHAASANLDAIFKKFANRALTDDQPVAEVAVICLARMHFLLDIEDAENVLKNLGTKLAADKSFIVSLMSIYEHLENGAELENRAIGHVEIVWKSAFSQILKSQITDETVQIIALLLRAPQFCVVLEEELVILQEFRGVISDAHRFDTFQCLKEHRLQYPLNIKEVLRRCRNGGEDFEMEERETSLEEENEDEEDENSIFSTSKSESSEEEEDSEEEILRAGVRRQRVEIETDEEDY